MAVDVFLASIQGREEGENTISGITTQMGGCEVSTGHAMGQRGSASCGQVRGRRGDVGGVHLGNSAGRAIRG